MRKSYRDDNGEKIFRYSIRKYHFGAASVAVAALMFFANGAVAASETITPVTASDVVTAGSDGNADGNPAFSDEGDSKKALTDQPAELKPSDELKAKEAPAEETNQGQAGAEPNSAQSETNPANQEPPQAGEVREQEQPTVADTTAAKSTQGNLQALLAKLTLSSMQELHAEVETRLAAAKAVLEDPKATQAQVDEQARLMAELTSRVNQALTPSLETPTILEKAGLTSTGLASTGLATPEGATTAQTSGGKGRRRTLSEPTSDENQSMPSAGGDSTGSGAGSQATPQTLPTYTNTEGKNGVYGLKDELEFITEQLRANGASADKIQVAKAAVDKFNEAFSKGDTISQSDFDAALADLKKSRELIEGVLSEKEANGVVASSPLEPRALNGGSSDYEAIPTEDESARADNVTIQPRTNATGWSGFRSMPAGARTRNARSADQNRAGTGIYKNKYRYYFERGQDPDSPYSRYTLAFFNLKRPQGAGIPELVKGLESYLTAKVTPTGNGFNWDIEINKGRQSVDGLSFIFTVPSGQIIKPGTVTVTKTDDLGTTSHSASASGSDDELSASLQRANAQNVAKGTPVNTNAQNIGRHSSQPNCYSVRTLQDFVTGEGGKFGDAYYSRGGGENRGRYDEFHDASELLLGDAKLKQVIDSRGTTYYGRVAGNNKYRIAFQTTGNDDLDKLSYLAAIKGFINGRANYGLVLHARTNSEKGFADGTKFRLKGNGYYEVDKNTAYFTNSGLYGEGSVVKTDGNNKVYSYAKYDDRPLDSGVKGVLTSSKTRGSDGAFELDVKSYSEYVDEADRGLDKETAIHDAEAAGQNITWYKGADEISKENLTKDAISTPGVHTYKYKVSYNDGSYNDGTINFVTKPKKPTIDTNLSTAAGTTTNIRVSNVDSNTTVELYKKGNKGQSDTLVSSISSGNQGGTVTFNNITVDYANYYVKQKVNGTWYGQDGTKREGVYSDQSSEKDASAIVIERIGAIGGQNDTTWKGKPALNNITDFNLPAGSDVLIGFRAKSPKGLKSLNITVLGGLKGKSEEYYGQQGDTTLGVNLRSPGGNSGGYSVIVTATDRLGNVKEYRMGINFPPNSGSFEKNPTEDYITTPEKLKGKALVPLATEQPPIVLRVEGIHASNSTGIDKANQWRVFLVNGGKNVEDRESGSQKAVDFQDHIVAETVLKEGGVAEFVSADPARPFKKENLGRKPLRIVVAAVNRTTHQIVDKYVSALSDDTLEATYPQFTKSPELYKGTNEITASIGRLQADKAQVRYTDETGMDKTVGFSKVNSRWEKDNPNQDTTIVVTEDAGNTGTATVHIPYGTAKRGTEIFASQKVDANTEYSEESKIEVPTGPTVKHPNKPEISQSPEDLDVTIKIGQGNANRATVLFSDSRNSFRTFMLSKKGSSWEKDQAQAVPEVSVTSTNDGTALVRIPYGVAKVGTQVVANQRKEGQTNPSENAFHKVLGRLEGLTNTAQADGSVDITVPDTATKFDLTYHNQQNNITETLHYNKDAQGRWGIVTDITANGNRFTLPKGLVADGTTVSVIASNDDRTTTTVESKAKFEQPSATTSATRQNGDVEVTLPTDAEDVTLTYKNKQNTSTTVTLAKQGNTWSSSTNLPDGVSLANGKVTFDYTKLNRDTAITTDSTRGQNDVKSQANSVSHNIPEHTAPTTQNVVIAAGATPTNEQLATGVTVATKQSVVAKETQTAIAAGTTKVVATTLTYQDGSTEDVDITVKSRPNTPTVTKSRENLVDEALESTARSISGTATPRATVTITLQDGTHRTAQADENGAWSYALKDREVLSYTPNGFNNNRTDTLGVNATRVKVSQTVDNISSAEKEIDVYLGNANVVGAVAAGRDIDLSIPHDAYTVAVKVAGRGSDIGITRDATGNWRIVDARDRDAIEIVQGSANQDPSRINLTLRLKNTDPASTPSFRLQKGDNKIETRVHVPIGDNIWGRPASGWVGSSVTNTLPTVEWQSGKEVQEGQTIPSPTVDELKDYFVGHDAEDDAGKTVGYGASSQRNLRVRVFTGRDTARNIEGTSVSAQANGRIAPGNYTLVLSTRDAAGEESTTLEKNIVIQSYADYYRNTVKYPRAEEKVTYNDTAIANGNFTPAAKTRFKDKIQELNGTVLPATTTYTTGNTDDNNKVAVLGFPDGSTIDISHAVVAKPTEPTFTRTAGDEHDPKLQDIDRVVRGTALQSATKVVLTLQTGKTVEIDANNGKDPANLQTGEGALKNGVWIYKLENNMYLRQTEHTAEIGSSDQPVKVKQIVFTAESDESKIYVAKKRNFEGKTITAAKGSQTLTALKADARKGIKYTENNVEKDFPGDFTARWKDGQPDIERVGTRTYKVRLSETGSSRVDERGVKITVTNPAPAELTHENKQNGTTRIKLPDDADRVVFTIPGDNQLNDVTVTHSERDGWTVPANSVLTKDGDYLVVKSKDVGGTRNITAVATKGEGNLKSAETAASITVPEHQVETKKIRKVKGTALTNTDLLKAVEVDNKKSAKLKVGTTEPETVGFHEVDVTVTYNDKSTEDVKVAYEILESTVEVPTTGIEGEYPHPTVDLTGKQVGDKVPYTPQDITGNDGKVWKPKNPAAIEIVVGQTPPSVEYVAKATDQGTVEVPTTGIEGEYPHPTVDLTGKQVGDKVPYTPQDITGNDGKVWKPKNPAAIEIVVGQTPPSVEYVAKATDQGDKKSEAKKEID
ncbi:YSIRK-type signal peptide-containing protein, partial [Streptococcus pseudopneumoniae]|uniref:YSIRK-type signal peptide-containing protein n=1 Tax=Streptococcus pseudopneumoniae TaxID=257758 RepID=UPI000E736C45